MSVFLAQRQTYRKTQPQNAPTINFSNPLAEGLVGVWHPSLLPSLENGPTQISGKSGKGLDFVKASSQRSSIPLKKPFLIASTGATLVSVGYTTAATGVIGTYASINNGSAYFAQLLRGDLSRGVCAAYYDGVNGSSFTEWSSASLPDRTLAVHAITADPELRLVVFLNGVNVTLGNQNSGFYGSTELTQLTVGHVGNGGTGEYLDGCVFHALAYNRKLSLSEIANISKNPWQIFKPVEKRIWIPSTPGSISRPGSDVSVSGWSGVPSSNLYTNIDEASFDDADYILSPALTTSAAGATFSLTVALEPGTYVVTIRTQQNSSLGQFRCVLKDSGNTTVGTTAWQTVTGSFVSYTLSVVVSGGIATTVTIEAKI